MTAPVEVQVQRFLTRQFIHFGDTKSIALLRSIRVPDGEGGFRWTPPTLPIGPQEVLILSTATREIQSRQTEEGELVQPESLVLGRWDLDIKRFDEFTADGLTYKVVWVYPNRVYETKADIITLRGQ